ncbi:MAG TPA: SCO family protein [Herpetosiphonaceae bacterium]
MRRNGTIGSADRRARIGGRSVWTRRAALVVMPLLLLVALASPARADPGRPEDLLAAAAFDQQVGAQVPLDLAFRDEMGRSTQLGRYLGARPTILVLAYYECPNLCGVVLNELAANLRRLSLRIGQHFDVVTVSIDPRETPMLAAAKKQALLQHHGLARTADGWHFLTGTHEAIDRLAQTVGFRYAYDPRQDQYSHPGGLLVLTPQGKIARYLYGLQYSLTDLRLSLVEASAGKIGSPIDKVLLRCYRYDPTTGTYQVVVLSVVRLASLAMLLVVGGFVAVLVRRERRVKVRAVPGG